MFTFLQGLDKDLSISLLHQLRNLWTHTSTSIEGNTLTLGETAFVLEEGLTISGKPLKDHEEVVGHARAIDLVYELVQNNKFLTEEKLFALHKAVQTESIVDVYSPVGGWKREPNSTVAVIDGKQVIFEYAPPADIPTLMGEWFELYANLMQSLENEPKEALKAYVKLHVAFVRIHPFFDGNGRLARLVSNLPVLKAGFPPVIIPRQKRKQYIDALSVCHSVFGQLKAGSSLLPDEKVLRPFEMFCEEAWRESLALVDEAHEKQRLR